MKTLLITDLVNSSGLIPPQTIPDHSILQGTFITSLNQSSNNDQPFKSPPKSQQSQPSKRNLKKINTDTFFMSDEVHQQVLSTIEKLENIVNSQHELDSLWGEIKKIFLDELKTLPLLPKCGSKKKQ